MAEFIDRALGDFCKGHQDSIDTLKFLSPEMRDKAKAWLDECAAKAGEGDTDDKVGSFNQNFEQVRRQLEGLGQRPGPALPRLYAHLTKPA